MPYHNSLQPLINQSAVNSAVTCLPFLNRKIVDTKRQMLVQFLNAVTGKMLCGAGHIRICILNTLDVCTDIGKNRIRIIAEAACIYDGITPIFVNIRHRIEHPVAPQCTRFTAGHITEMIGVVGAFSGTAFSSSSNERSFRATAVSTVIAVGCNQQRNLAVFLIGHILLIDGFLVPTLPTQPPLMALCKRFLNGFFVHTRGGF